MINHLIPEMNPEAREMLFILLEKKNAYLHDFFFFAYFSMYVLKNSFFF